MNSKDKTETTENDLSENEIGSLKKEKQLLKNEIVNQQKDIDYLSAEISKNDVNNTALERNNADLKNQLTRQQEEITRLNQALDRIKSGVGFKIIRFCGTKIDKIRKTNTPNDVSNESKKKNEFSKFFRQTNKEESKVTTTKELSPDSKLAVTFSLRPPKKTPMTFQENAFNRHQQSTNYPESPEEQIYKKNFKVSVVIPTNSDESTLDYLLSIIKSQKGIKDLEIILVNSGLDNLNSLLKLSNVKLINIRPEEFNHGTTRNLGASKAKGDFIIFLTDDAIPSNDKLFYDMCKELSEIPNCGCVSPRHFPKSDADLMSKYTIANHFKFLKHFSTQVTPNSFDKLTIEQKRSAAQIDDVCACYRKSVFSKYQYSDLGFGEDLEMGIKLVKDGYTISNFGRSTVIHSHTRSADYWLKRAFTEHTICNPLLGAKITDFKKDYNISTEEEILEDLQLTYSSIGLTIDFLNQSKLKSIHQTFQNIHDGFPKFFLSREKPKSSDSSFDKLFKRIFKNLSKPKTKQSLLLKQYLKRLDSLEDFMAETYPSMMNVQDNLFDALYKIFGMFMGEVLSEFMLYSKKNKLKIKQLSEIEKILKSDV